ncbi:hypothetical protein C2E23DRAFT_807141 [Lenzites betulinus]|nr:hypothetical protein C2E23DRAFT_807141 [Lenzites betulinus]
MVVTRRTPAPPLPASRTHSTQPIPRIAKKVQPDAHSAPDKPSPLGNGSSADSAAKSAAGDVDKATNASPKSVKLKGKPKSKKGGKKKSGKSTGFVELLFRGLLLWFTIYTLSVCPEDEHLKSPVCRYLAEYRRLVIDPYIIPSIQHALAHPSVAPYVEKATPYADRAIRTAKPIAARAQKEFNAHVVPQWNKRVVPLYNQYAVPQLAKLDAQTAPYRSRIEQEYERLLEPYVVPAVATLNQWQHKACPYVVLAAQKTYDGYERARPYARPVWEKIKVVFGQLLAFLVEQRRQFVDPHVQKIWEHVKELSSGKPQSPSASKVYSSASSQLTKASSHVSKASAKISSTVSAVASSAVSHVGETVETVKSSASAATEKLSSEVSTTSSALSSTASVISAAASTSLSSAVSAASDAVAPSASSLASVASASLAEAASSVTQDAPASASSLAESASEAVRDTASTLSTAATSVADEAASSASSVASVASSAIAQASVTVTEVLASVGDLSPSIASPVAEPIAEPDTELLEKLSDPDLEAFKAELGLEDDFLADPAHASAAAPAPVQTQTEEEKEALRRAQLEKTAQTRADIDRRHTEWERQLVERIAANKKALRKALVASRKAAVAELKEHPVIHKEIDELVEDTEKFLRGAEKYLVTLQAETRAKEDKKLIWDRVVSKVEEKFTARLHQTEAIVNGWYKEVLNKELTEVKTVVEEIKSIAERGQADIGMDYAYLDDVTYLDWQRYHDLLRRSENFTTDAYSIQDGSHPSPPINPVLTSLADLQNEVEDVVSGFETRLRRLTRTGVRAFGAAQDTSDDSEAQEPPVSGDETVSILPIEESALPEHTQSPADARPPPVVIGRGKEEVEAALNRIADLEGGKTSAPGDAQKGADADAVAQELAHEIVGEDTSAPPSAPLQLHQEL